MTSDKLKPAEVDALRTTFEDHLRGVAFTGRYARFVTKDGTETLRKEEGAAASSVSGDARDEFWKAAIASAADYGEKAAWTG
ncbi:MAG: hypothetical protein H6816_08260 [Phycisphaerales bacterium]|nr:hypothetical protein [Phycisphaerales bacterium]